MANSIGVNTALGLNLTPFGFPHDDKDEVTETGNLVEELNRIRSENKKLSEMLTLVCENYDNLHKHFKDLKRKNPEIERPGAATSRKRNAGADIHHDNRNNILTRSNGHINEESCSDELESFKRLKENNTKTKVSRVYVRTTAFDSTLIVKDGYQWRKYGQKVTRDNPSPRAYFKCSFAPTCPVKKKVQRSVEDRNVLVATYEGEHNHPLLTGTEISSSPSNCSLVLKSDDPNVTLDTTKQRQRGSKSAVDDNRKSVKLDDGNQDQAPVIQQIMVQEMAALLARDSNFKAAIAAAISRRFVDQTRTGQW